jgi:2-keto-3-deoxy-L-rhamnonate aldolase RhmA
MQPAIELRRKIAGNDPTLGVLISNHLWVEFIEIAIESGLDYVIIDTEHMSHGAERIADACRLGRMTGFPVLLRPARTDTESIRIAMDLGPCGMLLPMIESAEQLQRVRDGIYLPPRGLRRPGGPGNRWVRSFGYESFKTEIEDHVIIIPQIENALGLRNANEIAAHPIVTALGVGPFDLSAELGLCWQPQHPTFRAALATIRDAAKAATKPMWMIGDPDSLIQDGYRFLCIGEPTYVLQRALTTSVQHLRTTASSAATKSGETGDAAPAAPYDRSVRAPRVPANGNGNGKH